MIVPKLETKICEYLYQLPLEQQGHVLEFVRALAATQVRGVAGQALAKPMNKPIPAVERDRAEGGLTAHLPCRARYSRQVHGRQRAWASGHRT